MKVRFLKKGVARIAFVVVLLLMAMSVLAADGMPAYAGTGTPITTGKWVRGRTTSRDRVAEYTFYGRANKYVSIAMEKDDASARLDPYLQLEDPYGYIVAYNDDESYRSSNSLIDSYRLRRSGTYTILARSYDDATYGTFWIYVEIE